MCIHVISPCSSQTQFLLHVSFSEWNSIESTESIESVEDYF